MSTGRSAARRLWEQDSQLRRNNTCADLDHRDDRGQRSRVGCWRRNGEVTLDTNTITVRFVKQPRRRHRPHRPPAHQPPTPPRTPTTGSDTIPPRLLPPMPPTPPPTPQAPPALTPPAPRAPPAPPAPHRHHRHRHRWWHRHRRWDHHHRDHDHRHQSARVRCRPARWTPATAAPSVDLSSAGSSPPRRIPRRMHGFAGDPIVDEVEPSCERRRVFASHL